MPGFFQALEDEPIVFTALYEHIKLEDLQEIFAEMDKQLEANPMLYWIIDLSYLQLSHDSLIKIAEGIVLNLPGAFNDNRLGSSFFVATHETHDFEMALRDKLKDLYFNIRPLVFGNLGTAYDFAHNMWNFRKQ